MAKDNKSVGGWGAGKNDPVQMAKDGWYQNASGRWVKRYGEAAKIPRGIKKFETYTEEVNARLHGHPSKIVEELHAEDMVKHWPEYGREKRTANDGSTYFVTGPVIRSNQQMREYCKLSRQIMGAKGFRERGE